MSLGKSTTLLLAGASSLAIAAGTADAVTVNAFFTGTVTRADTTAPAGLPSGIAIGDTVSGQFSYDTSNNSSSSAGGFTTYSFPTGAASMQVQIGGYTWSAGSNISVAIGDDNTALGFVRDTATIAADSVSSSTFPGTLGRNRFYFTASDTSPNPTMVTSNNLPTGSSDLDFTNALAGGLIYSDNSTITQQKNIGFSIDASSWTFGAPVVPKPTLTARLWTH